ncbi:uncharacterized protein LOC111350276 [Spodoptera litura]|uniref:Uncharacterized protein LOC111350276 n=1 Tax=Spodoptera litura TaxID=69820 RepID=A0A9J7DWF3_SPOLT|nr:uncharacterized protein LOC111350276 [Spodoptera litura]
MSIPPLVCSTPPPPDQCEDDKDPGDFDLSYSLSQEDDDDEDNDYNYGNFSSFNHYGSNDKPLQINNQEDPKSIDNDTHKEMFMEYQISKEAEQSSSISQISTNGVHENKLKGEEDMNIEDLNLKLEEEIVINVVENCDENENSDQNTDSIKDLNIPCNSNNSSQDDDSTNMSPYENVIEPTPTKEILTDSDEAVVDQVLPDDQSINISVKHENTLGDTKEKEVDIPIITNRPIEEDCTVEKLNEIPESFQHSLNEFDIKSSENMQDDEFGDFDEFQFVNTNTTSVVASVVDSSNPWENNETSEVDFGNFTANFDDNNSPVEDSANTETRSSPSGEPHEIVKEDTCEDDDFGDFDDFKSSAKMESSEEQGEDPCHEMSVLNLQSTDNEHHIMESVTKVLTSVFVEEISEPSEEFEGKIESLLSETWGHLMETDERQPYIVNWNNSLGQKTLLKALCIDSRNILFGPKWGSHMPKYAANLSVAPLQPQKQAAAPSNVSQSEPMTDKPSSKPTTWSDPFSSEGQESCNTEHESAGGSIAPRPTDLDVFEAAMSTKSEKIYSSTLNVQPIRQINLPDTHIFTPTDSEIPRSKTIHYDPSPTVLLPQPVVPDAKNIDNPLTPTTSQMVKANTEDDSEYWEFQDFKGTPESSSLPGLVSQQKVPDESNVHTATTVNALPNPSVAYQTQLLQPIKIEPAMPTLNWPDPGEVKATYDDFTDFVSISTSLPETQDYTKPQDVELDTQSNTLKSDNFNDLKEKVKVVAEASKPENESLDDDFDTFQSALPSKATQSNKFKSNTFGDTQTHFEQPMDFDYASSKTNHMKSDTISFTTMTRPNEALTNNVSYNSHIPESTNKIALSSNTPVQTGLLQPTPASFAPVNTQNQRTTGQILQPLSLESYSQINWPSPGIDLQDLSRFNPVETLQSLKSDLSVSGLSKVASPVHSQKSTTVSQPPDDDVWGDFVSSKPKQQPSQPKKPPVFAEDDEWSDFISSPSVKSQNGLNTISLNVHTNSNIQKTVQNKFSMKNNQTPVDIPTLNYITPKSNPHKTYNDKHFQNL